jgi:S-DNA-T family DNA segregation ATPase FtsK/SpoIIIE
MSDDDAEESVTKLASGVAAGAWKPKALALFLDGADRLGASLAGQSIAELVAAASRAGLIVVADCETEQAGSGWGLLQSLKASRHGIALVPDQFDGDSVFRTSFPRLQRRDYPPGRGIYVRDGRLERVHIAQAGGFSMMAGEGEFSP